MIQQNDLQRYLQAQENVYKKAYSEIQKGCKQSHWMWFIFPQIIGLGHSDLSIYYAIKDLQEAALFLYHPILGNRLIELCDLLLKIKTSDAHEIFGSPDDQKLFSSMTLFNRIPNTNPIFKKVLTKYFQGKEDTRTLKIIKP